MESIETILTLRILVAALGEREKWWDSSFLNETNMKFLAFAFPRAPEIASIQGAVEAARRVHDERIGSKAVFHLFRQSYEMELTFLEKQRNGGRFLHELTAMFLDHQECLSKLMKLSGKFQELHEGPVLIPSSHGVEDMAAIYLWAFENDKKVFPYVLSVK